MSFIVLKTKNYIINNLISFDLEIFNVKKNINTIPRYISMLTCLKLCGKQLYKLKNKN